jgi:hypothetical protein
MQSSDKQGEMQLYLRTLLAQREMLRLLDLPPEVSRVAGLLFPAGSGEDVRSLYEHVYKNIFSLSHNGRVCFLNVCFGRGGRQTVLKPSRKTVSRTDRIDFSAILSVPML